MFIIKTIAICVYAFTLDLIPDRNQIAIITSDTPMRIIKTYVKQTEKDDDE